MRAVAATQAKLPLLCQYMFEKTEALFDPAMCQGFAIMDDSDDFAAAVIVSNVRYHNGKPIDIEISCATDRKFTWTPEVCKTIFTYIFGQLGCTRCTSITKKNNSKSREFLDALNFVLEGNIRRGYDGERDALIYGLLAEDCRFFEGLNG